MTLRARLIGMLAGLVLLGGTVAFAQSAVRTFTLVGSWELALTPNSPLASPFALQIPGLATFTSDGAVIADVGQIARIGAFFSTAHGIWQPSPVFGRFFVRTISFMTNPNATLRAKRILTMTVAPNANGDQFSGGYTLEVVDPTGAVLFTGSGSVTGDLIPHPLLP